MRTAEIDHRIARAMCSSGERDAGLQLMRTACASAGAVADEFPALFDLRRRAVVLRKEMAMLLHQEGARDEAETLLARSRTELEELAGRAPHDRRLPGLLATNVGLQAAWRRREGRLDEAIALARLGAEHAHRAMPPDAGNRQAAAFYCESVGQVVEYLLEAGHVGRARDAAATVAAHHPDAVPGNVQTARLLVQCLAAAARDAADGEPLVASIGEQAITCLEKAAALDAAQVRAAVRSPEFRVLRARPAFRRLAALLAESRPASAPTDAAGAGR